MSMAKNGISNELVRRAISALGGPTPTPGRWTVGVYETTSGMLERLKRPQSCVCLGDDVPNARMVIALCGDAEDPDSQADADLMAAAPDLLAACREALTLRNVAYQVDANPKLDLLERRRLDARLREIEGRIRSAVSRAEGGSDHGH